MALWRMAVQAILLAVVVSQAHAQYRLQQLLTGGAGPGGQEAATRWVLLPEEKTSGKQAASRPVKYYKIRPDLVRQHVESTRTAPKGNLPASLFRGGLADKLHPAQKSVLTDWLSDYFPKLFRPKKTDQLSDEDDEPVRPQHYPSYPDQSQYEAGYASHYQNPYPAPVYHNPYPAPAYQNPYPVAPAYPYPSHEADHYQQGPGPQGGYQYEPQPQGGGGGGGSYQYEPQGYDSFSPYADQRPAHNAAPPPPHSVFSEPLQQGEALQTPGYLNQYGSGGYASGYPQEENVDAPAKKVTTIG